MILSVILVFYPCRWAVTKYLYGDRPFVIISAQAPDVEGLDRHGYVQVRVSVSKMPAIISFQKGIDKYGQSRIRGIKIFG